MAGTLVEFHADFAGDELLAVGDGSLKHFPFGSIPEAVVDEFRIGGDEGVTQEHDFPVHSDLFQCAVCVVEDGSGGSFVHAAGFHTHETVFHDIDSADSVFGTEIVQFAHEICGGEFFAVDFDGDTLHEFDDHVFRFICRLGQGLGHDADFFRTFFPRIFQDAAFKGDVQQVTVHGIGFFQRAAHGDIVCMSVFDHFGTGLECPVGIAPCGDDLRSRVKCVCIEFKTDLVVAFTGGTVANGICAFLFADIHQSFGDERTGDGGAEKVVAFVDGIRLQHGEDEIPCKFFRQVFHIAF